MARTTSPLALVPASLAEANTVLEHIGTLTHRLEAITQDLEAKVALLRAEANTVAAPLEKKLKQLTASIEAYATAHRATILPKDKKSLVLPAGEIGWRLPPARVTVGRGGEAKAVEVIQSLGLTEFLRTVPTLDKEALLRDRPVIKGIRYTQKEAFYVKPHSGDKPETFPGVAKV
jgi:phage host-nuclease inhibitor protein Gam